MAISEFEIIRRYFADRGPRRADVTLGIGDDGAVVRLLSDCDLVVVADTMVSGVHFPAETRAEDLGYKSLAVNLSDAAAMGAAPAWATLALTVPRPDEAWLSAFARGFFESAERSGVQLIGGDTTRGPLTVTVQVLGCVPGGQAIRRSGARPGDLVFVTGTVGDAGLALRAWRDNPVLPAGHGDYLSARLHRPAPRSAEGVALRGVAAAMIDVSDGLAADLGHILEASGVGATLDLPEIPLSASFVAAAGAWDELRGEDDRLRLALTAGDDYELCFTAPAPLRARVEDIFSRSACGCRAIGVIESAPGLRLRRGDGTLLPLAREGYDHFAQEPRGAQR